MEEEERLPALTYAPLNPFIKQPQDSKEGREKEKREEEEEEEEEEDEEEEESGGWGGDPKKEKYSREEELKQNANKSKTARKIAAARVKKAKKALPKVEKTAYDVTEKAKWVKEAAVKTAENACKANIRETEKDRAQAKKEVSDAEKAEVEANDQHQADERDRNVSYFLQFHG